MSILKKQMSQCFQIDSTSGFSSSKSKFVGEEDIDTISKFCPKFTYYQKKKKKNGVFTLEKSGRHYLNQAIKLTRINIGTS